MNPEYINPMQWHQAQGIARQTCARFFRDGGKPADALMAFGLPANAVPAAEWSKAVEAIATALCTVPIKRAA
jgi:hypothetical protein